MENTTLTEIITVYERMHKGRAADSVFRLSKFGLPTNIEIDHPQRSVVEETVPLVPSFHDGVSASSELVLNTNQNHTLQLPIPLRQQEPLQQIDTCTSPTTMVNSNASKDSSTSNLSVLSDDSSDSGGGNKQFGSIASISTISDRKDLNLETDRIPNPADHLGAAVNNKRAILQKKSFPSLLSLPSTYQQQQQQQPNNVLDFNKYKFLHPKKYIFFSKTTKLIQSDLLEGLSKDYIQLLKSKFYWLNITSPNESDLSILFTSFNVHDLTISDIREGNTEEKIEIFKHYTFISLRLMTDHESMKERSEDMDFNILLFKDFVITIHDKQWASIKDILGFLNLLTSRTDSLLTPDWVLFSVFIELAQDAQFLVDNMEPEITQIRIGSKSLNEMSDVMRNIFDMEFQIYTISRFLKPKVNILRTLKTKCGKRLSKIVVRLLSDIREDFKEISHELGTLDHVLERSQNTFLALVNVEKSREANEMSKVMKRISEIALVFLPIQAIAGFLGMNVQVPFQSEDSTFPFWSIVIGSISLAIFAYFIRTFLFRKAYQVCMNLDRWKHSSSGGGRPHSQNDDDSNYSDDYSKFRRRYNV